MFTSHNAHAKNRSPFLDEWDNSSIWDIFYTKCVSFQDAITNANFLGGGVNTADGLKAMREQCFGPGDRNQIRNVGVLITGI